MKLSITINTAVLTALLAAGSLIAEQELEIAGALYALDAVENKKIILPLKKTEVKLTLSSGIVQAKVTQRFRNDTSHPLEAVYIFPLPSGAAVTDMELRVGGRIIKSVTKRKEEAKKVYEQAKAAGKKAALLEQERPNIFTTSVANFLPGETADITLTYMESAEYRKGLYEVTFPMVVGQRYIPAAAPVEGNLNPPLLHPSVDSGHRLSMDVEIDGLPVERIESTTHAIKVSENDGSHFVSLARELTVPNSEFNIKIYLQKQKTPQVAFINSESPSSNYGLLTVFPPIDDATTEKTDILPRDVIFLIDTSGSMGGDSIRQAKTGLKQCMKMLNSQDRFTIVRFSSDFSSFSPDLRDATEQKIDQANGFIDSLVANGGTEMQKALDHVLKIPATDGRMKLVVFMTDGCVGNEDSLMKLLTAKLGRARLFSFAIGSAPNEYLIRKMAEIARGQANFIRSHEDIDEVMSNFFKTIDAPVMTDISLTWKDAGGHEIENINCYPNPMPDVYYDRPMQVTAEYPSGFRGSVTVNGMLNGEAVNYSYLIEKADAGENRPIAKVFGKAHINNLMCSWLHAETPEVRTSVQEEIIEVALEHQLVSKFTSRVAVEEKLVEEKQPDGTLVTVNVQVPLPKGWDPTQFHATATNDTLLLLSGACMLLTGLFTRGYLKKAKHHA